ncbi:MAG: serine O-acetyltransferase [Nitrospinae bacterium]|nr:serine O-acetyltransferase [Nitrospinota bacterium]
MFETLKRDIQVAFERDPAARSVREVLLCYPGIHALLVHRVAHQLWTHGWLTLARYISHLGRFLTGIEIHPGARIGPGLFIDHGMGVVIGETTEIGANCTLYQGVTLGGTSLKKEKRHPSLGDNVVVGAGAKILGAMTIGDHSKIGAGSVVVTEVPPNSTVVGIPGRVVQRSGETVAAIDLNHHDLPDPEAQAINYLADKVRELERELHQLRQEVRRTRDEVL